MTGLIVSIALFNLLLAVMIGIFSYLLRHETYRLAQQLHIHIPSPVARFLRVTTILPLFVMFGILTYMLFGGFFF